MKLLPPLALLAALASGAAAAQDPTSDQLRALFESQMADIRAAKASEDLGASRGLVLSNVAPSGEAVAIAPAPDKLVAPAATGAASPGSTVPAATLDLGGGAAPKLAAPAEEPVQHWSLPRSEQVTYQVRFAFDSAALSPEEKPRLREVCAGMKAANVAQFRIIGHTDASGSAEYNQKLSVLRAEEVERFFVGDCGIEPARLEAIGVGEQFPYDEKNPDAAVNRRVEFQALS